MPQILCIDFAQCQIDSTLCRIVRSRDSPIRDIADSTNFCKYLCKLGTKLKITSGDYQGPQGLISGEKLRITILVLLSHPNFNPDCTVQYCNNKSISYLPILIVFFSSLPVTTKFCNFHNSGL
jgi:hypothetical protein